MYLQEICELLETYSGRDKVMRTLCYSTKLISGLTANNKLVSERFKIFSSQMSATRTVLRLFDDLPMLKFLLEYGLGRNEPDRYMATLGVVTNVIDQIYYPIEKVAWLAENRLISIENIESWDVASSICWVASIYLTLMKSLRYVNVLQKHKTCLHAASDSSVTKLQMKSRLNMEILTCIRLSLDLVHAVNTLPPGCLWSGKLNTWQVGLIGTLSSFLGLYQLFAKKAMNKSKSS